MTTSQFEALARYNSERGSGVVHANGWVTYMATVQALFDESQRKWCRGCGREILSGELYSGGPRDERVLCAGCYTAPGATQ